MCVTALVVLVACSSVGAATPKLNAVQLNRFKALYAIDHQGARATTTAIRPYVAPFETIVHSCGTARDGLTNKVVIVAQQAEVNGGRVVSALDVLQHVSFLLQKGSTCPLAFAIAESNLEAGIMPTPAQLRMAREGSDWVPPLGDNT